MTIPWHRLQSGALLLFTFFMISDPRTTPNTRIGRLLFASIVAIGAWYVQFRLFRTNGLLWSLAASALLTPLIDWLLPGQRYEWATASAAHRTPPRQAANAAAEPAAVVRASGHDGDLRSAPTSAPLDLPLAPASSATSSCTSLWTPAERTLS
jgi:hypothetical protein